MKLTAEIFRQQYTDSGKKHLLITGWRGKGKTTLFNKLIKFICSADTTLPGLTSVYIPQKGVMLRDNTTKADGFVRYYTSPADVSVVIGTADGAAAWGTVVPGQDPVMGIENIYMVTTAADFSVPVKVNGEEIGVITMSDFMKKTPVGDNKVTTAMFN